LSEEKETDGIFQVFGTIRLQTGHLVNTSAFSSNYRCRED
jgi:hypothetical protein